MGEIQENGKDLTHLLDFGEKASDWQGKEACPPSESPGIAPLLFAGECQGLIGIAAGLL